MRRAVQLFSVVTLTAGMTVAVDRPAAALTTTQLQPFSVGTVGFVDVTPFDPALGTLDSVSVNISGQLLVSGTTAPNILTIGSINVPVPFMFGVNVTQDYAGLGGKYFDFLSPAEFLFFGSASGTGEPFTFATTYTFDFDFTAVTDFLGFAPAGGSSSASALIPPIPGVGGLRSDFLATPVPLDQILLAQQGTDISLGGPPATITQVVANGLMQIDYQFTPAPVVPVTGPASLTLVGAGVVVLLGTLVRPRRAR
ncbi:MAG: hypothetical protein ACREM3_00135 [Candidatus Rokuibacteriota bacterium]